jgi:hypothetical protein
MVNNLKKMLTEELRCLGLPMVEKTSTRATTWARYPLGLSDRAIRFFFGEITPLCGVESLNVSQMFPGC